MRKLIILISLLLFIACKNDKEAQVLDLLEKHNLVLKQSSDNYKIALENYNSRSEAKVWTYLSRAKSVVYATKDFEKEAKSSSGSELKKRYEEFIKRIPKNAVPDSMQFILDTNLNYEHQQYYLNSVLIIENLVLQSALHDLDSMYNCY